MIMKMLDLVKYKNDQFCFIMDYCNDSLENFIKEYKDPFLPEKYILRIISMVCIPLYYIHSKKYVNCDLNPKNIVSKFLGN